jgi:uncharacterized protein YbaP (TraB family)
MIPRKTPHTTQRVLLALVLAAFALTLAGEAAAKSFLWRIDGAKGRKPSYLLGSIHMGKKGFYPLPKAVRDAFARSKVLVLEARPDRAMQAMGPLMREGMYWPPDALPKHVSAKTWAKVEARLKSKPMLLRAVRQMKAWVAAVTLSALDLKAAGFDPKLGVENHLLRKVGKRRVLELEGMVKQMKLFSGFSEKQQELFLLYSLEQAKQIRSMMPKMVRMWKRGDATGLGRFLRKVASKDKRLKAVEKALLDDRNHSMTKTIIGMLRKSKEPHFVVVGAAHLAGKVSIVKLLRKRGYRLQQL